MTGSRLHAQAPAASPSRDFRRCKRSPVKRAHRFDHAVLIGFAEIRLYGEGEDVAAGFFGRGGERAIFPLGPAVLFALRSADKRAEGGVTQIWFQCQVGA
ncbi:MAG: hypothetical protein VR75_00335 [Hyphomonadaceae bacterium BRH_c29]|nr:MAG: hypothetical protein VR75_00335 [Hyphomonadaceae bacterium BRH_c29]